MTISHNHFYAGHGMSIGCETNGGASAIRVQDLSVHGADNGLRIKSNSTRGGLVRDVRFEDVCIRATANPIFLDTNYLAHASDAAGRVPVFRDIAFIYVRVEGAGKVTLEGLDAEHRLEVKFGGVWFDEPGRMKVSAKHVQAALAPLPFTLDLKGDDVKVPQQSFGKDGEQVKKSCKATFVPFPITQY